MLLPITILMVLLGFATAAVSLIGETWDQRSRRLTKVGWVALVGFLAVAILSVSREILAVHGNRLEAKTRSLEQYADEAAKTFSGLPFEEVYAEVTLDAHAVEEALLTGECVQASIHLDLCADALSEADTEIVDFYIVHITEPRMQRYQAHPESLPTSVPNIADIIRTCGERNYSSEGRQWLLLFKAVGEAGWTWRALESLNAGPYQRQPLYFPLAQLCYCFPPSIAGLLGREISVMERNHGADAPSIVSQIRLSNCRSAVLPFLVLKERFREPYGATGHYVYKWLPSEALLVKEGIAYGHPPGFLFDLRSFKSYLIQVLRSEATDVVH